MCRSGSNLSKWSRVAVVYGVIWGAVSYFNGHLPLPEAFTVGHVASYTLIGTVVVGNVVKDWITSPWKRNIDG